jgi:hypothetical protein
MPRCRHSLQAGSRQWVCGFSKNPNRHHIARGGRRGSRGHLPATACSASLQPMYLSLRRSHPSLPSPRRSRQSQHPQASPPSHSLQSSPRALSLPRPPPLPACAPTLPSLPHAPRAQAGGAAGSSVGTGRLGITKCLHRRSLQGLQMCGWLSQDSHGNGGTPMRSRGADPPAAKSAHPAGRPPAPPRQRRPRVPELHRLRPRFCHAPPQLPGDKGRGGSEEWFGSSWCANLQRADAAALLAGGRSNAHASLGPRVPGMALIFISALPGRQQPPRRPRLQAPSVPFSPSPAHQWAPPTCVRGARGSVLGGRLRHALGLIACLAGLGLGVGPCVCVLRVGRGGGGERGGGGASSQVISSM